MQEINTDVILDNTLMLTLITADNLITLLTTTECEVCIDQLVTTPVIIIIVTITDHKKVHP